ncbi:hypothetical protein IAT38_001164 [Cryptococcus sp. DSM 104549]
MEGQNVDHGFLDIFSTTHQQTARDSLRGQGASKKARPSDAGSGASSRTASTYGATKGSSSSRGGAAFGSSAVKGRVASASASSSKGKSKGVVSLLSDDDEDDDGPAAPKSSADDVWADMMKSRDNSDALAAQMESTKKNAAREKARRAEEKRLAREKAEKKGQAEKVKVVQGKKIVGGSSEGARQTTLQSTSNGRLKLNKGASSGTSGKAKSKDASSTFEKQREATPPIEDDSDDDVEVRDVYDFSVMIGGESGKGGKAAKTASKVGAKASKASSSSAADTKGKAKAKLPTATSSSTSSRIPPPKLQSRAKRPNTPPSSGSSSDSSDELSMGHTPPRHATWSEHEQRAAPSSSSAVSLSRPRSHSRASSASSISIVGGPAVRSEATLPPPGKEKGKGVERSDILVPDSDAEQEPTPRAVKVYSLEGKSKSRAKRSSSSDIDDRSSKKERKNGSVSKPTFVDSDGSDSDEEEATPKVKKAKPKAKPGRTSAKKRIESSPVSGDEDSPEPEPKPKPKAKPKAVRKPVVVSPVKRTAAHAFFDQLPTMETSDYKEFDDDDFYNDLGPTQRKKPGEEVIDFEGMEAYDQEDREWLWSLMSAADLCPYCNQPLPLEPSENHQRIRAKLEKISTPAPTPLNPSARSLAWQQSIDFCTLHRAEATIIPLGLRAGYPREIDFARLDQRLEGGWVKREMDRIVLDPESSKLFREVKEEVKEVGRLRWGGIMHQSKEERLKAVKPGYYGELGRVILTDHFQKLRRWGYLPTVPPAQATVAAAVAADASTSSPSRQPQHATATALGDATHPLDANDFITHILVPEAATLLIMADRGCTGFSEAGYLEAEEVRHASVKFGEWRFREGDKAGRKVLEEIRKGGEEKKARCRKVWGKLRDKFKAWEAKDRRGDEEEKENRPPGSGRESGKEKGWKKSGSETMLVDELLTESSSQKTVRGDEEEEGDRGGWGSLDSEAWRQAIGIE